MQNGIVRHLCGKFFRILAPFHVRFASTFANPFKKLHEIISGMRTFTHTVVPEDSVNVKEFRRFLMIFFCARLFFEP
jgi:hypothetical protein